MGMLGHSPNHATLRLFSDADDDEDSDDDESYIGLSKSTSHHIVMLFGI